MKRIDSIEKWNILSAAMKEKGYRLWQMQYGWDMPEGFHAWFAKDGKNDVEVVTFDESVQKAIIDFNSSLFNI